MSVATDFKLEDRFLAEHGRIALGGMQALARLLLDQRRADAARGWRTAGFVSGYRGSPLGGLDQTLQLNQQVMEQHHIRFVPGLNEDLAATAVAGSQLVSHLPKPTYDGVFGMWYGKAPGVDRAGDAFKHGNFFGTPPRSGVLVVAGDDPANKSSTLPSSSEYALADCYMPVLYPADISEILWLGRMGYEMSRYTGAWIGFKIVTSVADSYEVVDLDGPAGSIAVVRPELEWRGRPWEATVRHITTPAQTNLMEPEVLDGRMEAAIAFAAANRLDEVHVRPGAARLGLVAAGRTFVELRHALARLGLDQADLERHGVGLLQLRMIHPLDRELIRSFARDVDELVIVEEKRPFVEQQVKQVLYGTTAAPRVLGKRDADGNALIPVEGELDADRLVTALAGHLAARLGPDRVRLPEPARTRIELPLMAPPRLPYFCSGCPHNRSTLVPDGSLAAGGIGCHAMTVFMDRTLGLTQMGGEGAQWVGAEAFTQTPHLFQNIGDGTFFHSGSLAVRQAVAANSNITFKLLYNSAVAMTGGQPVDGQIAVPDLTRMLEAEGVARTVVVADDPDRYPRSARWAQGVDVRHRDDMDAVQRELQDVPGVTVLIYDQVCAAEARRKRKRGLMEDPALRVFINESVCEGCGDCGVKSNCLSVVPVDTPFGRKTQIDQASCNKDYSCLLGDCPSFVTVIPGKTKAAKPKPVQFDAAFPEPARPAQANVLMIGIGGTGVVTTNQIVATAAMLDGLSARALDQTGLSQKGGAVVSHLRIAADTGDAPALIGAGEADAYLAFDVLAASSELNLKRCSSDRTRAVISTSKVPTGQMVSDVTAAFPEAGNLVDAIAARTVEEQPRTLDAQAIASALFGTAAQANLIVLGAAYQLGMLPVSAESIERAIKLNGTAVPVSQSAFRAGRKLMLNPDWDPAAKAEAVKPEPDARTTALIDRVGAGGELREVLRARVPDLVAYQNAAYAERYVRRVETVAQAERALGGDDRLTTAVALNLYKLMAYKDEYEVARLHLDSAGRAELEQRFGRGAKVRYMLHPPMLRDRGWDRKIAFGPWIRPVFRVLVGMRRLRGTALDPFGRTPIRTLERELVREYETVVERLLAGLDAGRLDLAVEIAQLPDMVRGYEHVKLRNVEPYRARLAELLAAYDGPREPVRS